jgi:esterase/lipase
MGSLIKGILFMPPTKILEEDDYLDEKEKEQREKEKEEERKNEVILETAHGSKIKLIKHIKNPNYMYLLISHGNAENIQIVYKWVKEYLTNFVNVNIILYEYTGYDMTQTDFGCSEQYIYNDADAAYNYLTNELNVPPNRIIIFGRSLGSGPACYLAEKYPVGGLFLNSGFTSAYRVVFKFRWTLPGDMFPNIDRMKNITCPVCIVHSVKDEIVPFYHARVMYEKSRNKFPPLFIDGTNHNTIDKYSDDVFKHMQKFFKHLDPNYVMKDISEFYKKL